jgi:hypothetical protein
MADKSASLAVSRDDADHHVARHEASRRVRFIHEIGFCMLRGRYP